MTTNNPIKWTVQPATDYLEQFGFLVSDVNRIVWHPEHALRVTDFTWDSLAEASRCIYAEWGYDHAISKSDDDEFGGEYGL